MHLTGGHCPVDPVPQESMMHAVAARGTVNAHAAGLWGVAVGRAGDFGSRGRRGTQRVGRGVIGYIECGAGLVVSWCLGQLARAGPSPDQECPGVAWIGRRLRQKLEERGKYSVNPSVFAGS